MYPMKFAPVYMERIWGGDNLQKVLGRQVAGTCIGECWELSTHEHGVSVVTNGPLAGKTFQHVMELYGDKIMGGAGADRSFPLLLKIIDAAQDLSVQVHPDDRQAALMNSERGKTEAWYVLSAKPGAAIIYGLKAGTTRERFADAIQTDVLASLRSVPIAAGDLIYIPAGTVHALCGGVMVYEIQQSSDTTYRIYDYGRLDKNGNRRELHLEQALQVIRYDQQLEENFKQSILQSPYFRIEICQTEQQTSYATGQQFIIMYIIEGAGLLAYTDADSKQDMAETIAKGTTVLIPACLDTFTVIGRIQWLRISEG